MFSSTSAFEAARPIDTLLDWKTIHNNMAWGLILLMGGGYALADAAQVTCVNKRFQVADLSVISSLGRTIWLYLTHLLVIIVDLSD